MDTVKRISKETGLKIREAEQTVLKNGLIANRFKLEVGNKLIPYIAIEVDDFQILDEKILAYIKEYAEFENIVIVSNFLSQDLTLELKEKKIGYMDRFNNIYLPVTLMSFSSEKKILRSTSDLNEFLLGYLFFKNNGFLQLTQEDIGSKIKKSATTVNFLLRKMEQEEKIIKFGSNKYAIKNVRSFFDDWRFLLKKFHNKNLKGRYFHPGKESSKSLVDYHSFRPDFVKEVSFGGAVIDEMKDGYIRNARSLNIYCPADSFSNVVEQLRLRPDPKGEISIYESPISLADKDGFVHDSLLCAELLNDDNPRIREAGEERLAKLLNKLNSEDYEKYYEKNL